VPDTHDHDVPRDTGVFIELPSIKSKCIIDEHMSGVSNEDKGPSHRGVL
jgi:hypothetical protein